MSDEMVQERPEPTAPVPAEDGHVEAVAENLAVAEPVEHDLGARLESTSVTIEEPALSPIEPATAVAEPPVAVPPPPPPPAPARHESHAASGGDEDEFEREMAALGMNTRMDDGMRALREGDVITGIVMRVDREGVLVDVGAKSEGIIRMNELSREPMANPHDIVSVGEKIKVYVLEPENQDGNPILSKKRADFEQAWDKVQHAKETGETMHAMVTDRVKGGLTVDLGIRGFVPASHVGTGSLKNNLEKYVGQSIPLKVIEVDKERRKVVLSNKLAMQEERDAKSAETKATLAPNQVRHGVVRRLTNYGAFIDLGGIDGLLHISEMSWTRINDPKEVLKEGQEIDVLILKMDLQQNRVSLGLRQILPDPWSEIANRYKEGDVITGSVTRIVPFGAFVQVEGGVEGIIPNNEMPRGKGGKPAAPLVANEEVTIKVIALRPEERKMTLSMRQLQPVEEGAPREPAEPGAPAADKPARASRSRERGGGGGERDDYTRYAPGRNEEPRFTIGDAFAAQKRDRKRDRRADAEIDEDDLGDIDIDDVGEAEHVEAEAEHLEAAEPAEEPSA